MAKKKYLFLSLLFSVYFIVFTASPIFGRGEFSTTYGQTCNAFNVRLLISDLLRSGVKKGDKHLHHANILFETKRGIISSETSKTVRASEYVSTPAGARAPVEIRLKTEFQHGPQKYQFVNRYHCGLSPPAA